MKESELWGKVAEAFEGPRPVWEVGLCSKLDSVKPEDEWRPEWLHAHRRLTAYVDANAQGDGVYLFAVWRDADEDGEGEWVCDRSPEARAKRAAVARQFEREARAEEEAAERSAERGESPDAS